MPLPMVQNNKAREWVGFAVAPSIVARGR